ncbi:hypothetical protein OAO87_02190 [bacterium]|nr:hypothetical protein [bacterium]
MDLPASEVPVMAILKEFRDMAGLRGRKSHKAQDPIKYEYEKHIDTPKAT